MASELQDLLDMVDEAPGWRTQRTTNGWRIYPADATKDTIHIYSRVSNTDRHSLENTKALLRRAGLPQLSRTKKTMPPRETTQPPPPTAPAHPSRDLIAEARCHLNAAIDALGKLDGVLAEMQVDNQKLAKLKELLQAVMT